jgi:hypothetical protein
MVGTFLVLDVFGLALLSRFIANPGVVTFAKHLFAAAMAAEPRPGG